MNSNYGHYAVETAAIIVFVIAPLMLIRHYSTRERQNGDPFGIGWRAIQMICLVMAVPAVILLSLEKVISPDVTGALFGSIIGFALAPKG